MASPAPLVLTLPRTGTSVPSGITLYRRTDLAVRVWVETPLLGRNRSAAMAVLASTSTELAEGRVLLMAGIGSPGARAASHLPNVMADAYRPAVTTPPSTQAAAVAEIRPRRAVAGRVASARSRASGSVCAAMVR